MSQFRHRSLVLVLLIQNLHASLNRSYTSTNVYEIHIFEALYHTEFRVVVCAYFIPCKERFLSIRNTFYDVDLKMTKVVFFHVFEMKAKITKIFP